MNSLEIPDYNHLEKLLFELKIRFKKIENLDDDLNYYIEFIPEKLGDSIGFVEVLMFYSNKMKKLVAICPRLYKLKKGDSTLEVLIALNKANAQLSKGSVSLYENNYVSYKYTEECQQIEFITIDKLIDIFNNIIAAILYTSEEIERLKEIEE